MNHRRPDNLKMVLLGAGVHTGSVEELRSEKEKNKIERRKLKNQKKELKKRIEKKN